VEKMYSDKGYMDIVEVILNNKEFKQIENIEHHGISRLDHSLKVSYYAYKVSKALRLNYHETARAGLLHDFFLSSEDRTTKDRVISTFVHPKEAAFNANETFGISKKEEDIIKSHMFPVNLNVPKYAESWIVNLVDKFIGGYEFSVKFQGKLKYATNLYLILLLNMIK